MADDIREAFKANLVELMEGKGVTQADVAKAINVSGTTVNNWTQGYNVPRMDRIDELCRYFRVSRERLLTRQNKIINFDFTAQSIAEEIYRDKNLRMLFDTAKNAKPEDLKTVHDMLKLLKERETGDDF